MKKLREQQIEVVFDALEYRVVVVRSSDIQQSVSRNPKLSGADLSSLSAAHLFTDDDLGISYIILPWSYDANMVAHEAWHAVRRMLVDSCHMALENEAVAYHLGYLAGEIYEFYKGGYSEKVTALQGA
jgi:hypothetical protein